MSSTISARAPRAAWVRIDAAVAGVLDRRVTRARLDAVLADALRVVAASMRAGATLQQAMARAAERGSDPVSRAFGSAASRIALGCPVEEEVERLAEHVATPAARLFAQVVRVQHRRGGDLGAPCHRLASLLHDRSRLDAEARSATAQARFSSRAVLAIPGLLAAGSAWRAPEAVAGMLQPGPLLLASPGIALITTGALVARRIARRACDLGDHGSGVRVDGMARRVVRRIAGDGPNARRGARLGAAALACCLPALVAGGITSAVLALIAVGAAIAWPWTDERRRRREHEAVAQSGIEALLEVSIALLAAGATAHEVATLAPASAPEPLRSALAPAVHRVGLGRSVASAFVGIPEVEASTQLDGWHHAICATAELGAPAVDVLEHLLRDARAARREHLRSVAQTAAPRMQLALVLLVVPGVMWLMLLATVGGLVEQLRASGVV
ncbi:MAG: tadB1 [Thermoleophilia bacterium]|nr:tadB1 [Thermoleophilia bacterium]